MKVLYIFTDMIRANRLNSCNKNIENNTLLDNFMESYGGTVYNNCFSPSPDTPRGIACLYTGLPSYKNGCDLRIKYPKQYLNPDCSTFFDLFLEKNYRIDCFANPLEREVGLYPKDIDALQNHNTEYDLDSYLSGITLEKDHMLFISIPDFHRALSDIGPTSDGEKEGYKQLTSSLNIIFKHYDKDSFDHIVMFSDHGFKFLDEWYDYKMDLPLLLNEDRINSFMYHRKKGDTLLQLDSHIISTTNLYSFTKKILNNTVTNQASLYDKSVQYVVGEDHIDFSVQMHQWIGLWYYVDNKSLYVRTLDEGYLFERGSSIYKKGIVIPFDKIIIIHSSFGEYLKRKDIFNLYTKANKELSPKNYANGNRRFFTKKPQIIQRFFFVLYIIKSKFLKKYL